MANDFLNNNYISILFFVIFTFAFLIFSPWNFNPIMHPPKLTQSVLIETMVNENEISPASGFCQTHLGKAGDLEISCNKLTKNRCLQTGCCVFTSNEKCSAGSIEGATYKTDKDGSLITMDHYYYRDKCFGNCPNL